MIQLNSKKSKTEKSRETPNSCVFKKRPVLLYLSIVLFIAWVGFLVAMIFL